MISATRREINKITTMRARRNGNNGNTMRVERTSTTHRNTNQRKHPHRMKVEVNNDISTRRQFKLQTNDKILTVKILKIEATTRCVDKIEGIPAKIVLRGGYTQILVNPMQLTDAEFTTWLEKLVEARRNRQERRPRPYRNFRKPYNSDQSEFKKPPLRNKLQSAQELDVQTIMEIFHCEYDDVVEAVDLYNMDVDESQSA